MNKGTVGIYRQLFCVNKRYDVDWQTRSTWPSEDSKILIIREERNINISRQGLGEKTKG